MKQIKGPNCEGKNVLCILCNGMFTFKEGRGGGGTSNLRDHLKNKHREARLGPRSATTPRPYSGQT